MHFRFSVVTNPLIQGEAIDSALEGEDDETKIDQEVAMVIAELGLVMVGQGSVRKTGSICIRFLLNPLPFRTASRSLLPEPHPPPKQTSRSDLPIFGKAICERVKQCFERYCQLVG